MKHTSDQKINLLRQEARSVVRELGLLNDAYFEVGVTLAERHLLIELSSSQDTLTAADIAERLLLDKSTISRVVARAIKKGFITGSTDQKDKRKRPLQLTELGKSTLLAFEPIAFNQTKNALETLTPEEVDLVYRGISLYAQGLKKARLQNTLSSSPQKKIDAIENLNQIDTQLQQLGYRLETYTSDDEEKLFAIFKEVVDTGRYFTYESNSLEEFHRQFLSSLSRVYVCRSLQGHVVGGFYLKPNYSGRLGHIANAAYMVKETHRGLGIGTLLIKASLRLARELGFLAMQFNTVLNENKNAIKLYEKLGFAIIGTIPDAVRNPDGSFQDSHIMYRKLND